MRPTVALRVAIPLAVSLVAACSDSTGSSGGGSTGIPTHDVSIVLDAATKGAAAFSPNPFAVSLAGGGTVIWANADFTSGYGSTGVSHHLVEDAGAFDSGVISPKKAYTFTFTATGTYTYHCSIHPTMTGTINVGS